MKEKKSIKSKAVISNSNNTISKIVNSYNKSDSNSDSKSDNKSDSNSDFRSNSKAINTIDQFIDRFKKFKKIIIITGAGISVSCGIPDFRSKEVGLYNNLDCSSIDIPSSELLFDLEYFRIDPAPFYKFAEILLPNDNILPSKCHRFIKYLEDKKMLLRNYTQNVDGLERKVGINKVIECHGSFSSFKCLDCNKIKKLDNDIKKCIKNKQVLYCDHKKCKGEGILKPEITFFGEKLPKIFEKISKDDIISKCDCIIVMGTSLKVGGSVHEILKNMDISIPRILINKNVVNVPNSREFDLCLLGDCDNIISYLCSSLQWIIDEPNPNINEWNCQLKDIGIYEISNS